MDGIVLTIIYLLASSSFVSKSKACETQYYKLGCYNDQPSPRTFPNLLLNARYSQARNNPGYSIEWDVKKYREFLPRFICDCAKAASSTGTKYFGIQYYAECWNGVAEPQDFLKLGLTNSCVNSSFEPCRAQSQQCTGTQFTNAIYYLPSPTNLSPITTESPPTTTEPLTRTQPPSTTTKLPSTTTQPPSTTIELPPTTTKLLPTSTNSLPTTTEPLPITTELPSTTSETPPTKTELPPTTTETPPTITESLSSTINPPSITSELPQIPTENFTRATAPPTESAPGCMKNADILIALDISSSISLAEFEKRKQLLADFVARFPVNEKAVHFALIRYNHLIHTDITFKNPAFYNVRLVQKAILQVPLLGGATLTQKALDKALHVFSSPEYGARSSSRKILIIVTDGYTYGGEETLEIPSLKLRLYGVKIVAVGFGQRTNLVGLTTMSNNVLTLDNIFKKTEDELLKIVDMLEHIVCEALSKVM